LQQGGALFIPPWFHGASIRRNRRDG
jgi:hypothetical protein